MPKFTRSSPLGFIQRSKIVHSLRVLVSKDTSMKVILYDHGSIPDADLLEWEDHPFHARSKQRKHQIDRAAGSALAHRHRLHHNHHLITWSILKFRFSRHHSSLASLQAPDRSIDLRERTDLARTGNASREIDGVLNCNGSTARTSSSHPHQLLFSFSFCCTAIALDRGEMFSKLHRTQFFKWSLIQLGFDIQLLDFLFVFHYCNSVWSLLFTVSFGNSS